VTVRGVVWGTGLLVLALGLVALPFSPACSTAENRPAHVPSQVAAFVDSKPAPAASTTEQPYDLQQAVPLLARPELKPALEALEADDATTAYRSAEQVHAKLQPSAREEKRWRYLLAHLAEQAGDRVVARAGYEAVATDPWALSGYARLGAARVALAAGDPRGAIALLQQIKATGPLASASDALLVQAALQINDNELAIAHAARYLNAQPLPQQWQEIARTYSRLSVEREEARSAAGQKASPLNEPILWLQRLRREAVPDLEQIADLLQRAVRLLPEAEQASASGFALTDRLAQLDALLTQRRYDEAEAAAQQISTEMVAQDPNKRGFTAQDCEARGARAKALAGLKQWGKAVDLSGDLLKQCADGTFRARAAFLAGKWAFSDKRYAAAIRFFADVEANPAKDTLGDDARLYTALAHEELSDHAKFVTLLSHLADDYPDGDMSREGMFRLALSYLAQRNFTAAIPLLERADSLPTGAGHGEQLGREQYFLARARLALGDQATSLAGLESLIEQQPLAYYMLHAWSRLNQLDPARAAAAVARGTTRAENTPFLFERSTELASPGFERALELLQAGDVDAAAGELTALGADGPSTAPNLLWGVAVLYQQLGATRLSHRISSYLRDTWIQRWPAGPWLQAWQVSFPRPYLSTVSQRARQSGVEPALMYAVMREESAFDAKAVSRANAYGLMQLLVGTAKGYSAQVGLPVTDQSLLTPQVNIAYGSRVLAAFAQQFPNNPLLVVPGYNAGPGNPKKWLKELPTTEFDLWVELIPFRETRDYTKRVLASRAAYAYLYGERKAEQLGLPLSVQ
jgi:soluble lytic murein transglycosylase